AAVALHVVAFVGIVLVGRYALMTVGPSRQEIEVLKFVTAPTSPGPPKPLGDDGGGKQTSEPSNAGAPGGGSNHEVMPASQGAPPPSSALPPIPAPPITAPLSPISIPQTVQAPSLVPPSTTGIGDPTAPPAPGDPSAGNNG